MKDHNGAIRDSQRRAQEFNAREDVRRAEEAERLAKIRAGKRRGNDPGDAASETPARPRPAPSSPGTVAALTSEIRDIVEGLHGRPKNKRGVQVVVAEVICRDLQPGWIAKVKVGGAIVAKCCTHAHFTPEDALRELLASTKSALGVSAE